MSDSGNIHEDLREKQQKEAQVEGSLRTPGASAFERPRFRATFGNAGAWVESRNYGITTEGKPNDDGYPVDSVHAQTFEVTFFRKLRLMMKAISALVPRCKTRRKNVELLTTRVGRQPDRRSLSTD